ncbi:MAG: alpha/beta hydrolase [Paludibacteraceae bacterium]|nr:alpha/beta hydrolase [Paludibacteraceae bacterium]
MKLNCRNAFSDLPFENGNEIPDALPMNIISGGCHLYGYLLKPDSRYDAPHPTAIVFHGFPGYTTNNDLEYALMRMGCVVVHINHRGAWGSEGHYLFTNLIDDAVAIAKWAHNPAITSQYGIDPDNIFLVGHSMGGMTVLNAAKHLPFIKGVAAIAPYDLAAAFEHGMEKELFTMIEIEGQCLKITSASDVYENAQDNYPVLALYETYNHLKKQHVLIVSAEYDTVAPPKFMNRPLAERLQSQSDCGTFQYHSIKTNHSFGGSRIELSYIIGNWIEDLYAK